MAITFNVQPGYQFSASERVTYSKLNLLGTPGITLAGTVDSSEITDGAITTQKLASGIDINSKVSDHNLALTKLAQGTHGQILYYDSNNDLVTLAPGTSGYFLRTKGAGADPEWAAQAGLSSVPYTDITTNGGDKYLTTNSSGTIEWINKPTANTVDVVLTSNLDAIRAANHETHNIGYVPEHIRVTVYCDTTDALTGYVAGDEFEIGHNFWSETGENRNAVNVIFDAATQDVRIQYESASGSVGSFRIQHKTGGNSITATSAILQNFKFKIRTWQSGFASTGTNGGPLTSEPGYYYTSASSTTLADILTGSQSDWTASFSHGFGSVPKLVRVVALCNATDSDTNYVAGDEIDIVNLYRASSGGSYPAATVTSSSSNVRVAFAEASSSYLTIQHKTSADWLRMSSASKSNFKLKVYAWK